MQKRTLFACLLTAMLAAASHVRAESSPEDRAAADALYEESAALIKAGRFKDAVEKLEASQKLDPGIGTTLRLAYCYEQIGRTASAWAVFNDAEGMARKAGDKRAEEAAKQAKRIEANLSRLVLDVAPENRAAGVEIRRDGKPLDPVVWTTPVPVDPGAHTIAAVKQGKAVWQTTVTVEAKAGTTKVKIPAAPEPEAVPIVPLSAPASISVSGAQRIAGIAVGGAGVVGLVIGAVFGGLTMKKVSDSKSNGHCDSDLASCDAIGLQLQHDARTTANITNAALAMGGAAVVAGVVLFATAPVRGGGAPAKSRAWVKLGPAAGAQMTGAVVQGGW